MNIVDFVVYLIVALLVLAVIFFVYILPAIKRKKTGQTTACSNCPDGARKRGRRLVKDYFSSKKKDENTK